MIYGPTYNTTDIFRAFRAYLHRILRVFRRRMQRKSSISSMANVSFYDIYVSQAICHIVSSFWSKSLFVNNLCKHQTLHTSLQVPDK